jgi:hypothetical protein
MHASIRTILGLSLATLLAGCGRSGLDASESQVASDGDEGLAASAQSTDLGSVVFENVTVSDPVQATAELALPSQLWPSGCVTRARTGQAEVTVKLTDCTGPFGLVHIDGEETVTFGVAASGALQATIEGVNLTADGGPIVHSATAVITFPSPTTRSVQWKGNWARTDDLGDMLQHTSDLTIAVDLAPGVPVCRSASGTAQTMVAVREVNTTITDYEVCHEPVTGQMGCPLGSVDHVGVTSGKTVEIRFNGTDEAAVTGPKGDMFEVPLVCAPLPS